MAAFDPNENSFETFADKGFKSVINLQTDEEEQNVSQEKEKELAKKHNLEYKHIGISKDNLDFFNKEIFKQTLIKVILNPDMKTELGINAYKLVVDEFNPLRNAQKFESLYTNLVYGN